MKEIFKKNLINKKDVNQKVNVAKKGQNLKIIKGDLGMTSDIGRILKIKNVCVCKDLSHNLNSVRKLEEAGLEVIYKNKEVHIKLKQAVLSKGDRIANLFIVFYIPPVKISSLTKAENQLLEHRSIGHSSKVKDAF